VIPSRLAKGQVYFVVGYEDEELTKMVIESYEYLGRHSPSAVSPGERAFHFRPIHPVVPGTNHEEVELEITEGQLKSLYDLAGLIDHLRHIE
jgi:hypothetical protein